MKGKKIMTSDARTEHRTVIKYCVNAQMTPTDTWKFIQKANPLANCSRVLVYKWHKRFSEGESNIHDKPRTGRPSILTEDNVERVRSMVMEDRRRTSGNFRFQRFA